MLFLFTVTEIATGHDIMEFTEEFSNLEEAEEWADENYNSDTYCTVCEAEEE